MKKPGLIAVFILLAIVVVSQNNKEVVFFDDFETYDPGGQLACQNPDDWATWNNDACGLEDAYISDMYSYSGSNSVNVVELDDNYYELETYFTSGVIKVSNMVFVPLSSNAYYNILSEDVMGKIQGWAFEVFFNNNGTGYINAGGDNAASFNYNMDTWVLSEVIVDLDNDHAFYIIDGILVHDWQWTLGAGGNGGQLQLAAVDFYGPYASTSYYFDDFNIETDVNTPPLLLPPNNLLLTWNSEDDVILTWEVPLASSPNKIKDGQEYFKGSNGFIGYNIYHNFPNGSFDFLDFSTQNSYIDEGGVFDGHCYKVTAVYDEGESDPTDEVCVLFSGDDVPFEQELSVFPNPATNLLNVKSDFQIKNIKVYNYAGQMILDKKTNNNFYEINTSQFEAGIYFFQIETGKGVVSRRIVVQ